MRKVFITFTSFALLMLAFNFASAQKHRLPELRYDYGALEPAIDARTMYIHYHKHHKAYVDNLNNAIRGTEAEELSLEEILINISEFSDDVRNNGGGHYNHNLYWKVMSPQRGRLGNQGLLAEKIALYFSSKDKLIEEINQAAMGIFGSGWVWLIITPDHKLKVVTTANQDNPLMDTEEHRGVPILGIDIWEHAYYIQYQNRRAEYLKNFWRVVDWRIVYANMEKAMESELLLKLK